MNRRTWAVVAACAGPMGWAGPSLGQAASSAQVWDVRFETDCRDAPAIGITMKARVAVLPNPAGTANFGVLRCGGAEGSVQLTLAHAHASVDGLGHGTISPGTTGDVGSGGALRLDTGGQPLTGTHWAFRGVFLPAGTGGSNGDAFNGLVGIDGQGRTTITSLVNSRLGLWDGVPRGWATLNGSEGLAGEFASIYRWVYVPAGRTGREYEPTATLTVRDLSARYVYAVNGQTPVGAAVCPVPDQVFSFETVIGPVVWREPLGGVVCAGGRIELSPRIVGLRPMAFQWYKDGEAVAGATAERLMIDGFTAERAGAYHLVASSACGVAATEEAVVSLNPARPPVVSAQPTGAAVCAGRAVTLSASVVSGGEGERLQWLRGPASGNGAAAGMTAVAGATGATLAIPSASESDDAWYRLRIDWACGSVLSEPARLTVDTRRPEFAGQPDDTLVRVGQTLRLEAVVGEAGGGAGESGGLSLRWHRNMAPLWDGGLGGRVSGAGTGVLEIREARFEDAGRYQLLAINGCASAVSAYATVTVDGPRETWGVPPTGRGQPPSLGGSGSVLTDGEDRPCVADFDGSGEVDGDDMADAIACYTMDPPCARMDVNGDGTIDGDDLADFVSAYFGGC